MIGVGIIGAGDFGAAHARAIAKISNINLVAASRTHEKALGEFCKRFDCQGYTDYQDLLANDEINAVVIATPHHLHTTIVEAAAKAKKHILLEKPMAPSLAECDQILKVVKDHNVQLMLGHVNHFVPAFQIAKKLLESGELGEIVYAQSTMTRPWMTPNRRDWHLNRLTGGGIWLTIGLHVVDQLSWLIDAPVRSVSADLQTRFHEQAADDLAVAFLRYRNGVSATATAIGYKTGVFSFLTELTCTKGLLKIDHANGVFIGKEESWQLVPESASETWMQDALVSEWQAFTRALETSNPMPVTGDYAQQIMQVMFAAERSSQEKMEVMI